MSFPLLKRLPGFQSGVWWKSLLVLVLLVLIIPSAPSLALEVEDTKPTNKNNSSIKGKTLANKTIELIQDNNIIQSIKADSDGQFIFSLNDLEEGNFSYMVKVCDSDKQKKCTTKAAQIIIDKTLPEKPTIALPDTLPDNDWEEVVIAGVAEPESKINLSYADLDLGEVKVDSNGNFTFTAKLVTGGHLLNAKSVDEAGNESEIFTKTVNFNPLRITAKVYRVVDGDTIKIDEGKVTVRYIGIDTPETVHPSKPVECLGKEASDKNKQLVEGKEIILEKDISETDKYGRLLRYIWLGDVLVNEQLVKEGYAKSSTYPPDVKHQTRFIQAEKEARESGKGLWGDVCNTASQNSQSITNTEMNKTAPSGNTSSGVYTCDCSKTCTQIATCEEAYFQLNNCSCKTRDADDDGVPCESICPGG
ncbi:thermonuclease family protein [Patescibacteria group bacterium]|nr:thermonuclease family protein [Patescibacteria group bacterium]